MSSTRPVLGGRVAPGFEGVADEFIRSFTERGDVGAAVAAFVGGEPVVDLWGGDARPGRPWTEGTIVPVFSTTKGAAALTVQLLADRGILDVDTPIAAVWPEFGAAGKEDITLADVMTHMSGVIAFAEAASLSQMQDELTDLDAIAGRIAAAPPRWEPGTRHGYHALTYGWILGEVVRRVDGRTLGTVFHEEIAVPYDVDFWIGLPESEDGRVADLIDAPPPTDPSVAAFLQLFSPETWTGQAHMVDHGGVLEVAAGFNDSRLRRAEVPAGGGIGNARALARMYAILAGGGALEGKRLLRPESIDQFATERVRGADAVLVLETRFGLGYARPTGLVRFGPNDEAFGHGGLGGSVAFADPVADVAIAYTPNQLQFPNLTTVTRSAALTEAVYEAIDG